MYHLINCRNSNSMLFWTETRACGRGHLSGCVLVGVPHSDPANEQMDCRTERSIERGRVDRLSSISGYKRGRNQDTLCWSLSLPLPSFISQNSSFRFFFLAFILTSSLTPYSFSTFFFSCLKHSSMRSWKGRRSSATLFPCRPIPLPNNGI